MSEIKTIGKPAWRPSQTDRNSSGWQGLVIHLTDRLQDLRVQNDKEQDDLSTAKLRGQIAEVKRLLDLNKDLPKPE